MENCDIRGSGQLVMGSEGVSVPGMVQGLFVTKNIMMQNLSKNIMMQNLSKYIMMQKKSLTQSEKHHANHHHMTQSRCEELGDGEKNPAGAILCLASLGRNTFF